MAIAFLLLGATTLSGNIFDKMCSNDIVGNSTAKYALFEMLIGITGAIFFFFSSGCRISLNFTTLMYALIYALVCLINTPLSLLLYKFATIAGIKIISSLFSLIGSLVLGFLLFNENIETIHIVRLLVISAAVFLVFIDAKRQESNNTPRETCEKETKKNNVLQVIIVFAGVLLLGLASTVIQKSFSVSRNVTDESSWLFMLHIFHIFIPLIIFIIAIIKDRNQFADSLEPLKLKRLFPVVLRTASFNLSSLVAVWIMARMDLAIYTPLSICIGLILGVVSSWIFRERMGVFSYLAVAVACITFAL